MRRAFKKAAREQEKLTAAKVREQKQKAREGSGRENDTLEKLIEDFMRANACDRTTALVRLGLRHLLSFDPS